MDTVLAGKPSRNIEIKAQIASAEEFQKKLAIAKELSGSDATLIVQHDVFFNSAEGRLKLRYLKVRLLSLSL
jgi:adenylate cyclase class IV